MYRYFILFASIIVFGACSGDKRQAPAVEVPLAVVTETHRAFFNNMSALCPNTYEGVVVFPQEAPEPFKGKRLLMIVEKCMEDELRMPFWVGDDKSRTWVLSFAEEGMIFKHDHLHEDGTPHDISNYGGIADSTGSAFQQNFPADTFTKKLLPEAAGNVWRIRMSEDKTMLSYVLERDGKMRFQADFDLSKPVVAQ